jgi:dipeptidyl aminopeptidase/acylaminoacyl peptidase
VLTTADDGHTLFLTGQGASPEGNRPFLRTLDLQTGETTELFRSEAPYYESPVDLLDVEEKTLLTSRESATDVPNYFVRDLDAGTVTAITNFPHPYPELVDIQKEFITYHRADGVQMTATLYLPAGYDAQRDGALPGLVWAYPREFKSADAASQVSDSPYRFTRVSYWGAVPFVTQGYAVLDNASMPIVGEGDMEPNDAFRKQLVMNAQAIIDEGSRRGVLDPDRVAVGGHSYGAFMTGNLLAHSDLFRAGIARSGAYNRTLTPFGFQSEERLFWDAPEIYFGMSPFMHADKVNEPILLIHGEADNNSGTFPIQSERFYNALKGLGATARLVMLPHESHGYRARESLLHMLWEENRWLEKYVKNAPPRSDGEVKVEGPTGS